MPASASSRSLVVEFRGVTRRFGECVANAGVSFEVEAGSIHGIVGENGAGKSTAMKMLYGIYGPSEGEILVDGVSRKWRTPMDAIAAGIGMVHQHFMLSGPETALDNIILGAEPLSGERSFIPKAFRPIRRARARARLEELSRQYGLAVPFDEPVERLPVGVQQRIEILKLLYRDARILILDEPTAVLTPQETLDLFANLKKLRAEGKTILIITHKLKEVMSFTDRVTVFRAGRTTGGVETAKSSPQELADLMVGRRVELNAPVEAAGKIGAPRLEIQKLTLESTVPGARPRLAELSFTVRSGEIVGIAGVEGNGQSELLQAILHPGEKSCRTAGTIRVLDKDVSQWSTAEIKRLGVGVVPEDRHHEGLLLGRSLTENFLLGLHHESRFQKSGFISGDALKSSVARALEAYDVRPRQANALASELSGGNQQKLIIAREFERKPKLLICAQPTRGVDVGAIEFIHRRIVDARDGGAGVLLVSSELDEVLALSDRILVMFEGRIVGEFARGQSDEKALGLKMGGGGGAA